MGKIGWIFLVLLLIPAAYSMSVKDLVSKYSFSISNGITLMSFNDYMKDTNENGIDDALILEVELNSSKVGSYLVSIVLFDVNGVIRNESNVSFTAGTKKFSVSFSTLGLSQNNFNYSIKVFNSSNSLLFRKDGD